MDVISLTDGGENHHSGADRPQEPTLDTRARAWNGRADRRPRIVSSIWNLHGDNYVSSYNHG